MTLPSAESEVLIAAPSFKRAPVAPVESARSLWNKKRLLRVSLGRSRW